MKDDILKKADFLLRTGGYEAVNFSTISDELETTRANIHYHFQSKKNLAIAVAEEYSSFTLSMLEKLSESCNRDFKLFLSKINDDLLRNLEQYDYQGYCVCTKIAQEKGHVPAELTRISEEHFRRLVELFKNIIVDSIKAGYITSKKNPDYLAREALQIYLGVAQMLQSLPEERKKGSFSRTRILQWVEEL